MLTIILIEVNDIVYINSTLVHCTVFVIVTLKLKNVTPVGNYMELDCD